MRLMQVIPAFASYAVFLRELAGRAREAGHDVAIVCAADAQEASVEETRGVRVFDLDMPRGTNVARHWMAGRSLRRIMANWRPDIVHAHFSAGMFSTALALRRGDPWVTFGTFHGLSFPLVKGAKGALVKAAESFAASRFDRVHVLTHDDYAALRRVLPSAPVAVQPGFGLGCEDRFIETPRRAPDERRSLRLAVGIPEHAVVFIFVGRLVAFKGFDLAVRAFWDFSRLASTDSRFVVLGAVDPLHPTGLTPDEWSRYSNDPRIVRAGTQYDVMPWMDLADVMLFPSEREGMPVCVMEALARRLPVLAKPVRGCRELVIDGQNGFLIAERTPSAWAERAMSIVNGTGGSVREAPTASCDRFRRSHWMTASLDTYAEALETRGRVPSPHPASCARAAS